MKKEEFASKLRFNAYQYISNCAYYIFQSFVLIIYFFIIFCRENWKFGVGVISSYSVGFYIFIYLKKNVS